MSQVTAKIEVECQSLLSRSECMQIAQKSIGDDVQIVNYLIKPVDGERKGFLGEYFVLEIVAESDRIGRVRKNYFVKIPAIRSNDQKDEAVKIFAKEARLYFSLLQDLSGYSKTKWKPECYFSRNNILVLEDLKALRYEHIPVSIAANSEHIKIFLSSLAAMHASGIAYENEVGKTIGSQYGGTLFETSIIKGFDWFETGVTALQALAAIHPKYQLPEHQKFIKEKFLTSIDSVYKMINESDRFRNVLCHRDTWQNNAMYHFRNGDYEKPSDSILVDFQICRYCPPAVDVMLAIYLNTNRSIRDSIMSDCLIWYYDRLTIELALMKIDVDDEISWESFLKSCTYLKLVPILYSGVAATLVKLPPGFLQDLQKRDPMKFANYRCTSRKEVLLELIETDELFKECMFEVIDDLMDIIYKDSLNNNNNNIN